jgi:quinol-cytochrome oxidoreductase complex cytochrome b subunit
MTQQPTVQEAKDEGQFDLLEPERTASATSLIGKVKQGEAWRSVFRHPGLDTPRGRALQSFSNVFLHIYPVKVPARVLKLRYSYRLGYIATVLFTVLVVTGVYLMFFYTPSVNSAYGDMQQLRTGVGFGQLIRNVHRWSAHLMVLVVVLHLVRTFLAGSYKRPRQFNWVLGMMLFAITLGFSFTGYLLPWDQLAYWAVTVGTGLVHYIPLVGNAISNVLIGGDQIGQATLQRFYALHVAVLPLLLALILMVHIWRVRKDGFAVTRGGTGAFAEEHTEVEVEPVVLVPTATPDDGSRVRLLGVVDRESVTAEERLTDDTVFTWPHMLVRHVVVGLGTVAVVLALGIAFAAPLRGIANPNETPEPAKAPWYFVGLQELLNHFDPLVAGIMIPLAFMATLIMLPYIDRNPATEARNRKVAIIAFSIVITAAVVLTIIGALFRGPGWVWIPPWKHSYLEL